MVVVTQLKVFTSQNITGCKLSYRNKRRVNNYTDKIRYYCINTDNNNHYKHYKLHRLVEILVTEILMFRVANMLYCRYLLPNLFTWKTKESQMVLPYRSCLEFSSLFTKLFKIANKILLTLKRSFKIYSIDHTCKPVRNSIHLR